ncbi:MAG: hypothetical protein U9N34_05690, partial [Candidatus Cloacimonadota bacterium]|nr:hypothetical protein [Candidatus Cloacimonadota bacterium]
MKKIIINICTPNNEEKWGDNAFAENLAFALRKLKYKIEIRCLNQWYKDDNFDISITITGKNKYKPNLNKFNIIWNISHPEVRTPQELNVFDLVLIASEKFI